MIIEWMVYQCATALLLGLAALAVERLVSVRGWPRRGIWAASLGACLLLPALARLEPEPALARDVLAPLVATVPPREAPYSRVAIQPKVAEGVASTASVSAGHVLQDSVLPTRGGAAIRTLERLGERIWMGLTLCVLSLYACASWTLLRRARRWPRQDVEGCVVRVSSCTGPVVLGYIRPEIVLPRWLLSASVSKRRLVLAHERAHVAAHDSLLWLFGLLVYAAVPWSIPIAWQVRRLRFAIEVDCDARVIRSGVGFHEYGHTLLAISQRRTLSPFAALSMAARRSLLERRLSILSTVKPVNAWLVAAFVTLCACCLAVAAELPIPRDAVDSVIELPPNYSSPYFLAAAESAARSAYRALFRGQLTGTASISVDLGADGRVFRIQSHEWPPGPLSEESLRFDEEVEEHDAYHFTGSHGREFLGWFGSQHDDGLYLSYRVLKWASDPARSAARVRAAVAADFPEFFRAYPARSAPASFSVVTVFMNEDGTINRSSLIGLFTTSPSGEDRQGYQRLIDLGLTPAQFAHRGSTGNWEDEISRLKYPNAPPLIIHYAWPRRAGDPPDEGNRLPAALKRFQQFQHGAKPHPADEQLPDSALMKRFFPETFEHGPDWPNETLWLVLDRAGKLWAAGKAEDFESTMMGIEGLYPGITLDSGRAREVATSTGAQVMLSMWWMGADSVASNTKSLNVPGHVDLIAMLRIVRDGQAVWETRLPLKVGITASGGLPGGRIEIIASAVGPDSADLLGRIESADVSVLPIAQSWSSPVVRLTYGDEATFTLNAADGQKWQAVLRPIRMATPIE